MRKMGISTCSNANILDRKFQNYHSKRKCSIFQNTGIVVSNMVLGQNTFCSISKVILFLSSRRLNVVECINAKIWNENKKLP
jgi:hypothetical protein